MMLGWLNTSCGGTDCGPGTQEVDGECLPGAVGGDENANANTNDAGNQNDNTNGNVNDNAGGFDPGSCAPGTSAVDEQCVADPVLGGFTVNVTEECGTIVSDVVTLTVTIAAIDGAGQALPSATGTVNLLGLGGVTPSVGIAELVDGTVTVTLTVSGTSNSAQILALSDNGQISGRSAPFVVVAEEISVSSLTGPVDTLRAGSPFTVNATLGSNGCRDLTGLEGVLVFSADNDVEVSPAQVAVDGSASVAAELRLSNVTAPVSPTLTASFLANGSSRSLELSVVPTIDFAGLTDARLLSDGTVELNWATATGGSATDDYVYTAYRSTMANMLGTAVTPTATGIATSVVVPLPDTPSAGDTFFFTVRVDDAIMDGTDTNLIQLPVTFADVVYVDADNASSLARDGSASQPFSTISEALTSVGAGPAVLYVSDDVYTEAVDLSGTSGVQLIGGFEGWTNSSSIPSDWMRGVNNTVVQPAATTPSLIAGAGSVVSGTSFVSTGAVATVGATESLTAINSTFSGTSPVMTALGPVTLNGTDLSATGALPTCLDSDVDASIVGGIFTCSGLDVTATGRLSVRGTIFNNSGQVDFGGGTLLEMADGVRFNGNLTRDCLSIGTTAALDSPDVDLVGVTFDNCGTAISGSNATALRSFILMNSQSIGNSADVIGGITVANADPMTTPVMIVGNSLRVNDSGDRLPFRIEADPSAHDVVIDGNSFLNEGLDLQLLASVDGSAATVVIQNNYFEGPNTSLNIESQRGVEADLDLRVERNTFSGNFNGRGDAMIVRALPNGNANVVVVDNEFTRIDKVLDFVSSGYGVTNVAFGRNEWTGGFTRYPSADGAVQLTTAASDGGVIEVYDNEFQPPSGFLAQTALRVVSNANVNNRNEESDIVVRNNNLGFGRVRLSGAGNMNVSGNDIEALTDAIDVDLGEAVTELGAPRSVNVIGNEITLTTTSLLDRVSRVSVRSGPDDEHALVVDDNTVSIDPTSFNSNASGFLVSSRGNTNSNQSVQVSGNIFTGAGLTANGYAVGGVLDMSVSANTILVPETRGFRGYTRIFGTDTTLQVVENTIVAASAPMELVTSSDGPDSTYDLDVLRNLMVAGAGSAIVDLEMTRGTPAFTLDGVLSNNVFVGFEEFEGGTPSGALAAEVESSLPVALSVIHNSVIGPFEGPVFAVVANGVAAGSSVDLVDNLVDAPVMTAGDVISITSNAVNVVSTLTNNLAPVEGNGLVLGSPTYRSLITDVFALSDQGGLIFNVSGSNTPPLGARVLLVGEAFVRVVVDVDGTQIELDGPAREATTGDLIALVLSPGSGTFPTYGLVPGTTGAGAATDTGDIGASGGAEPYLPLMP